MEIQSDYPPALSVWIQALAKARRLDQLDREKRTVIEQDVESRRALALVLLDTKEYEQAEELLRLSVESGEGEPQDLGLLAQAIMAPIQIAWQRNPPLPWSTPVDEIARLEEAEGLLTEVIDAWALIENRRRFHSALGLREHARAMQGKFELAREDCQRILGEDPAHPLALYHSGLLALQTRDFAEAIKYLEQSLTNPLQQESTHIPLAAAYLLNGQPRDVLRILLWDRSDEREQPMPVYVEELGLIAQAAQMLGETAQVASVAEQLCALPKDDPLVLEALASVDLMQGNVDNAIKYLQQALGLAHGHLKDYITLQLADVYHRQRRFDKAIPLYETVVPADVDSPPTRNYIVSLLNSGDWKKAYDLSVKIRNGGGAIPVISEVEAKIAEYVGDLEPALHLFMELAKLEPDNPERFLRAASIHIRLGKPEEAANFLDPVVERFWNDPRALISAAGVFAQANRPASDVLSFAYRARRLGMDNPEIHLAYVYLFIRPETENDPSLDLSPCEVGPGSSVQLTSGRRIEWCTILEEEAADRGKWEFLSSDSVAQKLLRHEVGETIQLKEGPYEQLAYKITEIQSKYVRAFQETLLNFGTWFPDHPGLHSFRIVDNDIAPIFRVTEMARRWQTEMHKLYASRQLTLEGFAQSIGRSIAAAWGGNVADGNQIIASAGTHQEQKYHHRVLESNTGVTVDLMALFTLKYLNQLGVLADRFQQVYVAQASIDVLIEDVQMLRQFDQEHGSIGREGERYTLTTIPKEVVAHNIQFVEQILAFAQENCRVMPIARALELGRERFEQTEFVLGRSSIASVLVAEETDTLLYSDDFLLRTVAQHDFSVAGVWTQPVLSSACDQGILKEEEYCDSVAALVLANYSYVPLNILVLIHVLRESQWRVNPTVEGVFAPLGAKTTTSDAVNIVADLIKQVWAEPIPVYQKQHIMDLCLRTLATGRDSELIAHVLQSALQERFPLVEHQLQQVTKEIVRWLEVHRSLGV